MVTISLVGDPLNQWELGRKVKLSTWAKISIDEVHFARACDSEALVVKPQDENGEITAEIPNLLLQTSENITVYPVHVSDGCEKTLCDCTFSIRKRPKPSDYVYTEVEILNYKTLENRMKAIEENGVSEEQLAKAVADYLAKNPIDTGVQFETDQTLTLENGVLFVNTTNDMEQDNTLPITSAGVFATVGNIEALLKTI